MSKRKKNIEEFFSKYESNFNTALNGDGSGVADAVQPFFANCFVESGPTGVICGQNNDEFVDRISQNFQFYRGIGSKGMNILSKDITLLDDLHATVNVYWRYTYEKDSSEGTIDFHVIYFLTTVDGDLKIFSYIAGDEMKALREHGLITEEQAAAH
ncbi:MAG TPA: hypothetical protein VFE50_07560 [Cyclobacteriaceae bacterium]|nr:hypothetical protein [Cyclobacteriaceae bacterium]